MAALTFEQASQQIAAYLDQNAGDIRYYAKLDAIEGWDHHKSQWPVGSLFAVEGQILYALTRLYKPEAIYEIGTHAGCSASHFLSALEETGNGRLICADPVGNAGYMIDDALRGPLSIFNSDGPDLVAGTGKVTVWPDGRRRKLPIPDIIFEDGSHAREDVRRSAEQARDLLPVGGLYIVHDALHFLVGDAVRGGISDAGLDNVLYVLIEPSDCGLAIWRKG